MWEERCNIITPCTGRARHQRKQKAATDLMGEKIQNIFYFKINEMPVKLKQLLKFLSDLFFINDS